MSGFEKILNGLGLGIVWEGDENEDEDFEDENDATSKKKAPQTATALKKTRKEPAQQHTERSAQPQVVLLEPTKTLDAQDICNELKAEKTVVVNVEKLGEAEIVRLYDFVMGATYALDAKIKDISENVFVVAPYNVEIKLGEVDSGDKFLEEDEATENYDTYTDYEDDF